MSTDYITVESKSILLEVSPTPEECVNKLSVWCDCSKILYAERM